MRILRGISRMEPFLGKGLLTSEGDEHLRNRRLAQPAFHRQRIAGFADLMARHTDQMLSTWAPGARLDVTGRWRCSTTWSMGWWPPGARAAR